MINFFSLLIFSLLSCNIVFDREKLLPPNESNPQIDNIKKEFLLHWRDKNNCFISYEPADSTMVEMEWSAPMQEFKFGRIIHTKNYDSLVVVFSWRFDWNSSFGLEQITKTYPFVMIREGDNWVFHCLTHSFSDSRPNIERQLISAEDMIIAMYYKDDEGKEDPTFWFRLFNYDHCSTGGRAKNELYSEMIQEHGKKYFLDFLQEQKKEEEKKHEERLKRVREKYK